mgnify:CR=1 FL=1
MDKEFYTARDLADKLGLNIITVYRYINAKKIIAYKIGKEFRIDKSSFLSFLEKTKLNK